MPFTSPLGFYSNDANSVEPWDSTEIGHFSDIEQTLCVGTIDGQKRSDSSGSYMSFIAQSKGAAGVNGNGDVNVIPAVYSDPSGNVVAESYNTGTGISLRTKDTNSDSTHQLIISGDSNNFVKITAKNGSNAPDGLNIQALDMNFNASAGVVSIITPNVVSMSGSSINMNVGGPQFLDMTGDSDTLYMETGNALNIDSATLSLLVSDSNDASHQLTISGDSNGIIHVVAQTGSDLLSLEGNRVALNASSGACAINSPSNVAVGVNSQTLNITGAVGSVTLTPSNYDALNISPPDLNGSPHEVQISGDSAGKVKISAITGSDTLWLNGYSVDCSASGGSVGIQGPTAVNISGGNVAVTGSALTFNGFNVLTDSTIVNWLANAGVVGLTSTASSALFYKRHGSDIDVYYHLTGTGQGTSFGFTCPVACSASAPSVITEPGTAALDDNTNVQCYASIGFGSPIVTLYSGSGGSFGTSWTNKATGRQAYGMIRYPI
jgi:hypothetical protein